MDGDRPFKSVQSLRRKSDPLSPAILRIVVVEAEESDALMVKLVILSKYDADLRCFTSCRDALQELKVRAADLLIVNCVMHQMSGEEMVRELMIRKVSNPILFVSGYVSAETVFNWFPQAPNISFLQKPFSPQQLHVELEKHFTPVPLSSKRQP